jgi:hypothetical protein
MQDNIVRRWHVTAVLMTRYVVLCVYRSQEGAMKLQIAQEGLGRSPADGDEAQWPESVDANSGTHWGISRNVTERI